MSKKVENSQESRRQTRALTRQSLSGVEMADNGGQIAGNSTYADSQRYPEQVTLNMIMDKLSSIELGQDSLRRTLESKMDRLRNELLANTDQKLQAMKTDIYTDISRLDVAYRQIRDDLEHIQNTPIQHAENRPYTGNPVDDVSTTVIAYNLPRAPAEDGADGDTLDDVVASLLNAISTDTNVFRSIQTSRLQNPRQGNVGLVKIALETTAQKIALLRAKRQLKSHDDYNNVYIKSSKTHAERLIETNARTIIQQIPNGKDFRITASGRIVKRNDRPHSTRDSTPSSSENHDRGGARTRRSGLTRIISTEHTRSPVRASNSGSLPTIEDARDGHSTPARNNDITANETHLDPSPPTANH